MSVTPLWRAFFFFFDGTPFAGGSHFVERIERRPGDYVGIAPVKKVQVSNPRQIRPRLMTVVTAIYAPETMSASQSLHSSITAKPFLACFFSPGKALLF